MKILLLGSGGREHALARKMASSPLCEKIFIAPGNPGTEHHGTNVNVDIMDHIAVGDFIEVKEIDCLVVGPEAPLVAGITDDLAVRFPNLIIVGPSAEGALLEGSKSYAKAFMSRHHIPTAEYFETSKDNLQDGLKFLDTMTPPYVLKADGLAGGKGVLIIDNLEEAQSELSDMLSGKFGEASSTVVIEEFLDGIEFSVFVLTDGKDYVILPEAKDYKRIGEGDSGLNTGGMGAVSPVPFANETLMYKVIEQVIDPTINGLRVEEIDYKGFVFFGLIVVNGEPFVIEYNCRMGDPETEAVMPRLKSDLVEAFIAMNNGTLDNYEVIIDPKAAATIILVSGGYPEAYQKGNPISGIEQTSNSIIFHSGTKLSNEKLVTNGGRVIAITTLHDDYKVALEMSNANAEIIQFEGKNYRKDIGFDL